MMKEAITEMREDLKLKDLGQYYCSENYINVMGMNVTDGIAYIMQNGYSWFVTDAIIILRLQLKNEPFCCIKLELNGSEAKTIITDGNDKVLYTQDYKFTDAKRE